MASKGEGDLSSKIIQALRDRGLNAWKFHGDAFSMRGFPDIHGITPCGRFIAFETKQPGETPRADQHYWLDLFRVERCVVGWGTSVDDALRIIFRQLTAAERMIANKRAKIKTRLDEFSDAG